MSELLNQYWVFVASPSGLGDERTAFRDTVREHNESDAEWRGVTFKPVGWEATLGGVARPQSLINDEIERCDYFVLVLWDRWGSRPDARGEDGYSSACEEEFHLAMRCFDDPEKPMRQVVIFFKGVDPQKMADPGPQLKKLLTFRKTLEKEKKHLLMTFDAEEEFRGFLRKYLANWVRDHEAEKRKEAAGQ